MNAIKLESYNLLFPWRHHLLTQFQHTELRRLTEKDLMGILSVDWVPLWIDGMIENIIWAVTSSNHANTRRNPISANRREVMIDKFSSDLEVSNYIYHIEDVWSSTKFADYTLKKIAVESNWVHVLTPTNTIVGCSTPSVISMYKELGFSIVPFELIDIKWSDDMESSNFRANVPWYLLKHIVKLILDWKDWTQDDLVLREVSKVTKDLYLRYAIDKLLYRVYSDPLLWNDGDITETRDYRTYVSSFDEWAERKYDMIKDLVKSWIIVDIWCCTGSLINMLTRDPNFFESDFYGIEVARALYDECVKRKEEKYFWVENVFFFQRNAVRDTVFPDNHVNTFITSSLTHEIFSYQWVGELSSFADLLYKQLNLWGVWINVDVVWPKNKDEIILMELDRTDWSNEWDIDIVWDKKTFLDRLSTWWKFLRFAKDFRKSELDQIWFEECDRLSDSMVRIKMWDACEFMSKKEYTDNWDSEMHERFCFWSFDDWKRFLESKWFQIDMRSRSFQNSWIVENRRKLDKNPLRLYKGHEAIKLYKDDDEGLDRIDYPVTNMIMIAKK